MQNNQMSSSFTKLHTPKLKEPVPLYQDADGNVTDDITKASTNIVGNPVVMGFSKKKFRLKSDSKKPLTFNPNDPNARLLALQTRATLNQLISSPTNYNDKFGDIEFANNSANAVIEKLNNSKPSNLDNNE